MTLAGLVPAAVRAARLHGDEGAAVVGAELYDGAVGRGATAARSGPSAYRPAIVLCGSSGHDVHLHLREADEVQRRAAVSAHPPDRAPDGARWAVGARASSGSPSPGWQPRTVNSKSPGEGSVTGRPPTTPVESAVEPTEVAARTRGSP